MSVQRLTLVTYGHAGGAIGQREHHMLRGPAALIWLTASAWCSEKARRAVPPRPDVILAGPVAEPPAMRREPNGRSQRGDSALNKTLDHLLSFVVGN